MQPPKVMPVVVLWRGPTTILRNGIQEQNKKELQAVDHQNLLGVFPNNMIVWNPPRCWVMFHSLPSSQHLTDPYHRIDMPYLEESREVSEQPACLGKW